MTNYWLDRLAGEPVRYTLSARLSVAPSGPCGADADAEPAVQLIPICRTGRAIAVTLIPQALVGTVTLDGVRVPAGLHVVSHTTRLSVGETTLWVAASSEPETRVYDAAVDGEVLYCSRTKARIQAGETIVICGGLGGRPCGQVYKQAAWELDLPCHECKRRPTAPEWRPPQARAPQAGVQSRLATLRARRSS